MAEFRRLGISAAALALVAVCAIALGQSTQTDHSAMHHGDVSDDSSPKLPAWHSVAATIANGVRWSVTSSDPAQVVHIRGLRFAEVLVSGSHHQPHHLMMARGESHHWAAGCVIRR